jgi:hypothetical protein
MALFVIFSNGSTAGYVATPYLYSENRRIISFLPVLSVVCWLSVFAVVGGGWCFGELGFDLIVLNQWFLAPRVTMFVI